MSGGGCSINFDGKVSAGDFIVIDFSNSHIKGGLVECKVVRISTQQGDKKILHLNFTILNEADRGNITKFVNQKQMDTKRLQR
jgi:c-di-GMP-binding flagellar brake protein YcgR